ncbi:DUF4179 domain-containing protein [Acinetobacter guerrae]|uniref:DUF4179 domain-containing protein n=1 Tax=Acinetobacter guerrae TaxID=1843371 RepID=UPI00125EE375|nr:DUF4179 domain-containing protein [Acinetobacter guerrae]
MKMQLIKVLGLSLSLGLVSQIGTAAVIKDTQIKPTEKNLMVEKALDQQKRNLSSLPTTDDELKMLNTIRVAPTQNFFATQHQRFSRFVQSFFQPHTS